MIVASHLPGPTYNRIYANLVGGSPACCHGTRMVKEPLDWSIKDRQSWVNSHTCEVWKTTRHGEDMGSCTMDDPPHTWKQMKSCSPPMFLLVCLAGDFSFQRRTKHHFGSSQISGSKSAIRSSNWLPIRAMVQIFGLCSSQNIMGWSKSLLKTWSHWME